MHYKTIVLELLEQRAELHEQLRRAHRLLATVEQYALDLKASHEAIRTEFQRADPDSDPWQISSEAFERALQELEDRLPPAPATDETEPLSLDEAMTFIRRRQPPK
ncbi:MAG TPA: hypothetical protein VGE52_10665 [Pirellulales bacterium]